MASVEVDQFLPQPPGRVWQALTDPVLLARWLMPNDFKPVVGHAFTFRTEPVPRHGFDGVVHCQVLGLEPPKLMRFSWRSGNLDTVVSWFLAPEGTGEIGRAALLQQNDANKEDAHHDVQDNDEIEQDLHF